jgi:ribokinase
MLDAMHERTILTIGERLEPRGDDALDWSLITQSSGVYLTAGDVAAVRRAREAPVLVATPRARTALEDDSLLLDALVFSAHDPDERAWAERVSGRTRLLVATEGAAGGRWHGESEGEWRAVPAPGPPRDTYGCGDSFAAGLTLGLAQGLEVADAAMLGARLGAAALAVQGAP